MEESSNGKLEEVQKVVKEDSGELKTEDESVRVVVVDGNPESVKENHEGSDSSSSSSSDEEAEPDEKSPQVVDSGEFKEEKVVTNSVENEVPQSEELNDGEEVSVVQVAVTKLDSKGTEEVSDETSGVSEEVPHQASKVNEEATLPSSDENDGVSSVATELVTKVIEEVSTAIKETKLPASKNNTGESSDTVNVESKEKEAESLPALANSGNVDNITDAGETAEEPEVLENNGNPPIISLSQRTVRPTSWISCCGLFEAFRRSDR